MSENQPQPDAPPAAEQTPPSPEQIRDMLADLPEITTPHDAAEALSRAKKLSQRGKLPGFAPSPAKGPGLFTCAAFGAPFDYRLIIDHWEMGGDRGMTFRADRLKKLPTIFAVVLAFTVWPGVVFTDSLLNTWFGWYPNPWWFTWAWYIPLTAIPIPWIWRSVSRKSQASALVHAYEQIDKITTAVEGDYIPDEPANGPDEDAAESEPAQS